jgi:hypothetical protein
MPGVTDAIGTATAAVATGADGIAIAVANAIATPPVMTAARIAMPIAAAVIGRRVLSAMTAIATTRAIVRVAVMADANPQRATKAHVTRATGIRAIGIKAIATRVVATGVTGIDPASARPNVNR